MKNYKPTLLVEDDSVDAMKAHYLIIMRTSAQNGGKAICWIP